jgi:hypothetical protein
MLFTFTIDFSDDPRSKSKSKVRRRQVPHALFLVKVLPSHDAEHISSKVRVGETRWVFGDLMWLKQCHKLPLTGNGVYTTYYGDLGDGLLLFWPHTLLLMFFSWKNWTLGLSHGQVVYDPQILVIILSMWQSQTAAENWVITISTGIYVSFFFWITTISTVDVFPDLWKTNGFPFGKWFAHVSIPLRSQ